MGLHITEAGSPLEYIMKCPRLPLSHSTGPVCDVAGAVDGGTVLLQGSYDYHHYMQV